MNIEQLEILSLTSLILFCVIGAFDGLYFHYYKYKLHQYSETRFEHQIHGLRGLLFSPIALIFFVIDSGGGILFFGLVLLIIDLILEVFDILVEKKSRKNLGGISPGETLCHVFATGFRLLALGFMISTKPKQSFLLTENELNLLEFTPLVIVGVLFRVTSFLGGLLHFIPQKSASIS